MQKASGGYTYRLVTNVSSSVLTVPWEPKRFGTGTKGAHSNAFSASMSGKSTRTHAPASMRRRQRGSLSRQAGRRGIAATRRDSATDSPHSGHFPSGGWARTSYPQPWHGRSTDIASV